MGIVSLKNLIDILIYLCFTDVKLCRFLLQNRASLGQRRIFIFSFGGGGWIDIWGEGGCCCLLWPGPGGNVQKGQGKCLTKLVF